jgi:hypothetical protein
MDIVTIAANITQIPEGNLPDLGKGALGGICIIVVILVIFWLVSKADK